VALVALGASSSGDGDGLGVTMAVLSLFAWAWYFIASKRARTNLATFEYMTVMNVVALVVVAPLALLWGDLFDPGNALDGPKAFVILMIVVIPGSGHILINWAHGHTTLVMTSLITLAMPVIAAASAAVFLDQSVSAGQVVGIGLVLVALATVIIWDARTAAGTSEPAP
jgi:drug/metabolite transporter (DMT)-like permease